jgi:hypothetical protein
VVVRSKGSGCLLGFSFLGEAGLVCGLWISYGKVFFALMLYSVGGRLSLLIFAATIALIRIDFDGDALWRRDLCPFLAAS